MALPRMGDDKSSMPETIALRGENTLGRCASTAPYFGMAPKTAMTAV
jgi:hypothetical protein